MPSGEPMHSTGRGGAGNIGVDSNTYVDGDIVREGTPGVSANDYSAGRGGAGNIIHPTESGKAGKPSEEIVPESATRVPGESYQNFHTGRGGEGNVHKDKYGGHSSAKEQAAADGHKEGLMEKVKHAIGMDHKKEKTPEPK
ncbi:hypothetical protein HII31_03382 [Pseudocercospora fuligena]|uniref:Uncharacterized protein n=1 Tax=Pseudocercospora fuligena TaxID=685502 RepID=A0A8H6RQA0_9PEZI|nr:hypothetical protein HII31_03382 [Pseudocercospora fuligena]